MDLTKGSSTKAPYFLWFVRATKCFIQARIFFYIKIYKEVLSLDLFQMLIVSFAFKII